MQRLVIRSNSETCFEETGEWSVVAENNIAKEFPIMQFYPKHIMKYHDFHMVAISRIGQEH